MDEVLAGYPRRLMAQNASRNRRSVTYSPAAGLMLLCSLALSLAAGIGQAQSTPDTISLTDSLGSTWNDVCSLAVGDNDMQWAVGDSGHVLKTVSGDASAEYTIGKGQFDLLGVWFADANHGWIVGYKRDEPGRGSGVVFGTVRGGNGAKDWVWSCPVIRPGVNVPFVKVQALDSRHVWVSCGDGHMLWSNDGGARWAVTAKHDGPDTGGKSGTQGSDHGK